MDHDPFRPNLPPAPTGIARKAIDSTPQPGALMGHTNPEPEPHWQQLQQYQKYRDYQQQQQQPRQRVRPQSSTEQPERPVRRPASQRSNPEPEPQQAPEPRSIAGRAPKRKVSPGHRRSPAASQAPSNPHQSWTKLNDQPDLSGIPGAHVISGEDRERYGAASRRR